MDIKNKKPIDKLRDSGKSGIIGTDDDRSPIAEMLPLGDTMYIIKGKGIYKYQLADTIDPQRTNPAVPDVQQKLLNYGSESELVVRTILTAKVLFKKTFLPQSFDSQQALLLTMSALKDLVAMHEITIALEADEKAAITIFEKQQSTKGALLLPSISNPEASCKNFIQKSEHTLQSLLGIVRLFYENAGTSKWFESLATLAETKYGKEDSFAKFMQDVLPFLKFVRNARHCIEHPKPHEKIVVTNFLLSPDMKILPPTIEVVHPTYHQPTISISKFMLELTDYMSRIFEMMIAFLCSKHVQPFAGLPLIVGDLSETYRRAWHGVRFSYGSFYNDGQFVPCG